MTELVFSVGEFVGVFNQTLENAYPKVEIIGEITDVNVWRDRLVFFDIKDSEASLNCMIPLASLGVELEDGMQVRVVGKPRLTQKGKFSLQAFTIIPEGEGALQRAFDLLKSKLEKEGLFATERKRILPEYPERIAVITAGQSAAWADFQKIAHERWPSLEIHLYDVQVQGSSSPAQVVQAIDAINSQSELVDLIVLTRGGGSLEDLQSFNDELVVRAVAQSRVPTISGVGHENDTTLVDFVSDLRGSTPTNAAQIALPDISLLRTDLARLKTDLSDSVLSGREMLQKQLLSNLRLLESQGGTAKFHDMLRTYKSDLARAQQVLTDEKRSSLNQLSKVLTALDPRQVLKRGYAIARVSGVATDGSGVSVGDTLAIELSKAQVISEVKDVKTSE